MIAAASAQLGWPYTWGGESRAEGGFDCSGLIDYALAAAGFPVGRPTAAGLQALTRAGRARRRPGRRPGLRRRSRPSRRAGRASGTRDRGAAPWGVRALRASARGRLDLGGPARRTGRHAIARRGAPRLGARGVALGPGCGEPGRGHPGGAARRPARGRERVRSRFGLAIRCARARTVHAGHVVGVVEPVAPEESTRSRCRDPRAGALPTGARRQGGRRSSRAPLRRTTTAGRKAGGPGLR